MALPVADYPDYLIYEDGRVWSNKTNKFLKASTTLTGYKYVQLFNDNGHQNKLIHRLVAFAFIPNPLNLPQINHKDENKANNKLDNLEWCTAKYNMNYGEGTKTRRLKIDYTKPCYAENARINGKTVSVPVDMYSKNGTFLKSFPSFIEASRITGISKSGIARTANGKRKSAGGFVWKRRGNDLLAYQFS